MSDEAREYCQTCGFSAPDCVCDPNRDEYATTCPYCDSKNIRDSRLNQTHFHMQNIPGGGRVCEDCNGYFEVIA